jgi:CRP-like cAMP-binding protein
MLFLDHDSPRQNHLLAQLPMQDYARLRVQFEPVQLCAGEVVCEPGTPMAFAYFPLNCALSQVNTTEAGDTAELNTTGPQGFVGTPLVMGETDTHHRIVVLQGGVAMRWRAEAFRAELARNPRLQQLCLASVHQQIDRMAQSILCARHHSVSQRLSSWLLCNAQALSVSSLQVTHETIAGMLGVRRESVTQAAGRLQADGLITNGRGRITLNKPDALGSQVCECFAVLRPQTLAAQADAQDLALAQGGAGVDAETWAQGSERMQEKTPEHVLTQDSLASGQAYKDWYDFAPVGLVTLDRQAHIVQSNLAGAILLGQTRSSPTLMSFVQLLDGPSRERFAPFFNEVFSGKCRRHCDVALRPHAHAPQALQWVRLHAVTDEDAQECRMVMVELGEDLRTTPQPALSARSTAHRPAPSSGPRHKGFQWPALQ